MKKKTTTKKAKKAKAPKEQSPFNVQPENMITADLARKMAQYRRDMAEIEASYRRACGQ